MGFKLDRVHVWSGEVAAPPAKLVTENLSWDKQSTHTDDRGSARVNTALSQARAEAVVGYLIKRGIAADRLVARGYGPSQPRAPNSTRKGREQNRRVEFHVERR